MSKSDIYQKIEEMYNNEKSKKFLIHLIHSYIPVDKCNKFIEKKNNMKCAITKTPLMSIDEVLGKSEEMAKASIENISKSFKSDKPIDLSESKKKIFGDKLMAFTGKDTTTFLCQEAIEELVNFVQTQMLMGDKTINYIINKEVKSRGMRF